MREGIIEGCLHRISNCIHAGRLSGDKICAQRAFCDLAGKVDVFDFCSVVAVCGFKNGIQMKEKAHCGECISCATDCGTGKTPVHYEHW